MNVLGEIGGDASLSRNGNEVSSVEELLFMSCVFCYLSGQT